MNKRELIYTLLDSSQSPARIPAAFFIHFDGGRGDKTYQRGQPAIDRHLEYFRHTDMDFVKIQYEHKFPDLPQIEKPSDWAQMPLYQEDFFAPPLEVLSGIVQAAKSEAMVIMTLYSPFMCAGHAVGAERLMAHIAEDPDAVAKGMEIVTASLMNFVKACIRIGVDGFYASTQGGETHRLAERTLFDQLVRPFDLAVMGEINAHCPFNILHVCDYAGGYDDIERFLDYPGQVVNIPLAIAGQPLSTVEAARLFQRPVMGGLDRHGALAHGTPDQIRAAAQSVLASAPPSFILGADCTVPGDTSWDNLRIAVETAHHFQS